MKKASKRWLGKNVKCYTRGFRNERIGPFDGLVKGRADDGDLLVEIPSLGHNQIFGEWPVQLRDIQEAV